MTNEERADGRPGEADALTAATESIDRYGDYPGTAYELARLAVAAAYPVIAAALAADADGSAALIEPLGDYWRGWIDGVTSFAKRIRVAAAGVTGSPE